MKALSYIVASILMLIITVALSGTAYMFMSGVFTGTIQGIEIADAYCSLGEVTFKIKNIGTSAITGLDIEQTNPQDDFLAKQFQGTIEPGKTVNYQDTCIGEQSRKCIYRITPPAGKTMTPEATCSGKPSSLVLSMHFDEEYGIETADSSGKNNNGILYGEIFNDGELKPNYPSDAPKRFDGKYGKALSFDGTDDYVEVLDATSLDFTTVFTIELWVYPRATGGDLFAKRNPASSIYEPYRVNFLDISRKLQVELSDSNINREFTTSVSALNLNEWNHVVLVWAGIDKTLYGYINGGNRESFIPSLTFSSLVVTAGDLIIGARSPTANHFNGIIDELRIYNRALTEDEIKESMQSSRPIIRPVAAWSFEGSGQYVNDTHVWIKGKYSSALSFDGDNDYVEVLYSPELDITDAITITAWINPSSISKATWQTIVVRRSWCCMGQSYWFTTLGDDLRFGWNGNNMYTSTVTDVLTYDTLQFVAVTYDSATSTTNFYVDRNLVFTTDSLSGQISSTNEPLWIGDESSNNYNFNGTIDEVKIYNKALI